MACCVPVARTGSRLVDNRITEIWARSRFMGNGSGSSFGRVSELGLLSGPNIPVEVGDATTVLVAPTMVAKGYHLERFILDL